MKSPRGEEKRWTDTVMVPVPEFLVDDVARFVMMQGMRAVAVEEGTAVDNDAVVQMLSGLNQRCRTVLGILAASTVKRANLTIGELAGRVGWTEHETVGAVHELSELVWSVFGPMLTLTSTGARDAKAVTINWDEQKVVLWAKLASAVLAAERQLARGA